MRFGVVFHGKWPFKIHFLWGFPWRFSDFTVCFTHLAIGGSLGVRTQVPVLVSSQNLISSLSWWHGSFSGHLGCFRRHWDSPNNFMACESWGMMTQIHPEKSNQRSIVVDIWSTRKLNMHWWMTKWPGFAAHRSHLLLKFSFEFAHLQVVFTWNTCGTLVEHLWNTCGTLVEHLWNTWLLGHPTKSDWHRSRSVTPCMLLVFLRRHHMEIFEPPNSWIFHRN